MLPYWLLFGGFATGAMLFEGRKTGLTGVTRILRFAVIAAMLMIGLRYKVGADWGPYQEIFWNMRYTGLANAVSRSDPAFGLLNWVVRQLGLKFWVVNTVCAAIFITGLFRFAARQSSPWLTCAVAVPYLLIVVGMGYTRQASALGFALLALNAIQDRSFAKFIFYMFAAATFHRSALVLLPIIAFSYSHNRLVTGAMAIGGGGLGYFLIVAPEVDTYIQRYSGAEQGAIESSGTLVRIAMNILPAVILFLARSRFNHGEDYFKVWRNFAALALVSLASFAYFGSNTAVDRLSIYLTPLQLFVFGNLPAALGGAHRSSRPVVILILAYSLAVQVVWLMLADNATFWIPYRVFPF